MGYGDHLFCNYPLLTTRHPLSPVFSHSCALFAQNTRGWGGLLLNRGSSSRCSPCLRGKHSSTGHRTQVIGHDSRPLTSLRSPSSVFVELIALLVGHPGDAQADQHGWSDQNKDAVLERRNHAGTGARRLRIAERAILRVGKRWNGQRRNQRGYAGGDSCSLFHRTAHFLSATGPVRYREYPSPEARGQYLRESGGSGAPLSAASPRRLLSARTAACEAGGCCPTRSYSASAERRSWPESAKGTNCASPAPGA